MTAIILSLRFPTISLRYTSNLSVEHRGTLDRLLRYGPPPPVVRLEAESVDDAGDSVEADHEDEEVGVVLGLHAGALRTARLYRVQGSLRLG